MEAYYVINNRIPRFLILSQEYQREEAEKYQEQLRQGFQLWLVEKVPSNLIRRKACSQCFEFARWLEEECIYLEHLKPGLFIDWVQKKGKQRKMVDFDEFLVYARHKIPEMKWLK